MGISIVRFEEGKSQKWGVLKGDIVYPVNGSYRSLADFLEEGVSEAKKAFKEETNGLAFADLKLLSPVTAPAQVICQGANYSAHRAEAGLAAQRAPYNLIFTKAPSSISGPNDEIVSPAHVKLLDYEIELGLVIKKEINSEVEVTTENMHEYIAGFVIANDVSARDVQFIENQWFKGKSYRTFCPVGPILYLIDEHETSYLHELELTLTVNGEVRQTAVTDQLLYKPEETLNELSNLLNFYPGDLWLTGTPGGVALKLTPDDLENLWNPFAKLEEKIARLNDSQAQNGRYLKDGDVVTCTIKSLDGKIDLGVQTTRVSVLEKVPAE